MRNATQPSQFGIVLTVGELPVSMRSASPDAVSSVKASNANAAGTELFERESATSENISLVRFLARQLHGRLPQHIELDDLISAGTIGLLDAVARFDGEKKVQFRTYAQFRIRGAMMDSLREGDWSPRTLRRQGRLIQQAKQALIAQGILAPNDQQMANEMQIPLATYQHLLTDLNGLEIGSLQLERNEESEEQLIDTIPGPANEDPLFQCLQGELRERLIAAIELLPEKERLVLNLYYHEELTMKEISQVLGVVGSRVSQLHAAAIQRLKSILHDASPESARKSSARRGASAKR